MQLPLYNRNHSLHSTIGADIYRDACVRYLTMSFRILIPTNASDALLGNFDPSAAIFSYSGSEHFDALWDPSFETTIPFQTIGSLADVTWGSEIYPFDE
jgi:hypothetical protein